jgi:phosphatidylinositol 4-kinase B
MDKFKYAENCISMLTTASLALKSIKEKDEMKESLKKFIKKFNKEYLSELNHQVMIPFRKGENSKWNSNYVVGIVEDDCNVFPTRKRVPYRIMIETVDQL